MNSFLRKLINKLSRVIALCIILAALIVSMTSSFTPLLDKHRADFEIWASRLLQMPVTIDKVQVSWYHYQPEVRLNQVTILNKDTRAPLLQIEKVRIFFSFFRSLREWKPIPVSALISGTDVNVYRTVSGQINIQGFPVLGGFQSQPFKQEASFQDMMAWLSQQPKLVLQNIDVRYASFDGEKKFVTLRNLSLVNINSEHHVTGQAILHQQIPTEITVALQWIGKTADLSQIKAQCYVYLTGVSVLQWLKGYSFQGWQIKQGLVSAKLWADWENGKWTKLQSNFQLYGLELYAETDKTTHRINRLSGNIGWKREGENQIFAGDDILIDLPGHFWPVTNFYLSLSPDANKQLSPKLFRVGYLDLDDVQSFLFSSPQFLSNASRDALAALHLRGDLQDVSVEFANAWNDWAHLSLRARFNRMSFLPWDQFPGAANVSGAINWNGTRGELSLNSNQVVLQYYSLFANPIALDQLVGNIEWQKNEKNKWLLQIKSLQALNQDLSANTNGTVTLLPNTSPFADLTTNFTVPNAQHILRYLPQHLFPTDLVKWLQGAFLSGEIESGNAVLKGSLNDFPFDKGNGTFLITSLLRNFDFRYAPDWPILRNANGRLAFSSRQMVAEIDSGQILNIPVGHVKGVIADLGGKQSQILEISGASIEGDLSQGLRFIQESPLQQTIGKTLSDIAMNGPMKLNLGLSIPLGNLEKIKVSGDVTMKNAKVLLVPWQLSLDDLTGLLHFTEKTLEAKALQGRIFNKPMQLNLETIQKSQNTSYTKASLTAELNLADLETWLRIPFSKIAQGKAKANIEINLIPGSPTEVHLRSNLLGVTINAPQPYAKNAEESKDFLADIILQEKQPLQVRFAYANTLSVALTLQRTVNEFRFVGGEVRLGSGMANWPKTSGLYITGYLDQLNWDKIQNAINQHASKDADSLLRSIDIRTDLIDILGQQFTQARLQIIPNKNNWNVQVTSREAIGQLLVPKRFSSKESMSGQFQKLYLRSPSSKMTSVILDLKSLPALSFTGNDIRYHNTQLGQVSFKTVPSKNGIDIKMLHIASPHIDLEAMGEWTVIKNRYQSHLQGVASSPKVSDLLDDLGLSVHNFISSNGRVQFNLNWEAAPYAPSISSLSGKASIELGKGRIIEVSQTAEATMGIGRMLSLFSLQTIPRRLALDFSDVFQKGYSFDSLRGDFNFENGDAYTNDARFDGPLASVNIYGRIGLVENDYDLTLSVTPHVTTSLPLAAATLITGTTPVVAIAAWLVNQAISTEVSKAATYYYEVRGPWNNPEWKSVKISGKR